MNDKISQKLNQYSEIRTNISETINKETDPDLLMVHEIVKLPSRGLLYPNKVSELEIEYMTTKDEDLITTPSLIDNGTVLTKLLSRKIKTKDVTPSMLLTGDINACLLFLRRSSYGDFYNVSVYDPRTDKPFNTTVDLSKLKYKEITKFPNEQGYFEYGELIKGKKIKFKLLTYGEENIVTQNVIAQKEIYGEENVSLTETKLKAHIISIDDNTDRNYINKFVEAMKAGDSNKLRKEIYDASPDVDMTYMFKTKDNYEFMGRLVMGVDFFFPSI